MKSRLLSLMNSLITSSLRLIERLLKSAQLRWDEFVEEWKALFKGRNKAKLTVLMWWVLREEGEGGMYLEFVIRTGMVFIELL